MNAIKGKVAALALIPFLLCSAGCVTSGKMHVRRDRLPKIPCKIAVVDYGTEGVALIGAILQETGSFEEVYTMRKTASMEDEGFRQEAWDEDIALLYIYDIHPIAAEGTTHIAENLGEITADVARTTAAMAGAIVTAPIGGIGAVAGKGVERLWPTQSSKRIRLDFWVVDVYTGDTIYSSSVVTTGKAVYSAYQKSGGKIIGDDQASDIAMHNAFVKSTEEMIKELDFKKDTFLHNEKTG